MAKFNFNLKPKSVKKIFTKNRIIQTKLPVPQSLKILRRLKEYESSNAVEQLPVIWDKAVNDKIYDPYGNCWIDFTSSIFVANTGHGNKEILKQIKKILDKPLLHSYYYPTIIRKKFLQALLKIVPKKLDKAILLSAGTEATERAIKITKIYGLNFKKEKKYIISWEGNYHGKTLNAQMLSGQFKDHSWIKNFDKNIIHLPFPYPWIIKKNCVSGKELFYQHLNLLKKKKILLSQIAGFFLESFQGYGAIFYPNDYVSEVAKFAKKNKSLLIFDEIQAGFYRTGKLFGFQHYNVIPDLVICGKGISGSLPLSAVIGKSKYINLDSAYTSTHGGHPLSCAAGLGNLIFMSKKKFLKDIKIKSIIMKNTLEEWKQKYPDRIKYVLGKGMIYGIFIFKKNENELDDLIVNKICEKAMQKGVFSICTGRGTIKLGPPLTISKSALIEGLNVYDECFKELFI